MNWYLKPKAPDDFLKQFPEYPPLVCQLLYDRGLQTQEAIDEFFNPDYSQDLHNPFLLKGMEKAVKRIFKAIKKQEKIVIFGDYDADGVCGAVLLREVLERLGASLGQITIPDRIFEGYGLNLEVVKKFAQDGTNLIITIDCGITDFKEINLAKSLGLEVIVIDHHQVVERLPKTKIIIDPIQKKDKYPFKELAAAGVVFKLVQALLKNQRPKTKDQKLFEGWEKWFLDLVAIATVADCMQLLGENRTLVKYGLIVLAQTRRLGLQELMKIARLTPTFETEKLRTNLDAYALGFILAPRLNAAGRIHHANLALELLMAKTRDEAQQRAKEINDFNRQRQKITDEIVAQVEKRIKNYQKIHPVIVEADGSWSPGVIGLVAGKIAEKYHRPTFIFNIKEKFSRGSARSIPQFNLVKAMESCADFLSEFGGHSQAAGAALPTKNLDAFRQKINHYARTILKEENLVPILEIDYEMKPEEINWQIYDQIQSFAPFGQANPRPLFLLSDLEIADLRTVGNNGKHLKLELGIRTPTPPPPSQASLGPHQESGTIKKFKAIGFNCGARCDELQINDKIDIVFELIVDEWNDMRDLQLKIVDFKKHEINNLY